MGSEAFTTTQAAIRLMRMSEVLRLTGIKSRSTIYELQASGDFPQAVRLTGKAISFVESEIHAWIRSRIEARPAPEATPATRPPRLRHRTASTTQATTRSSTATQVTTRSSTASTSTASTGVPPASTSIASTGVPPRRRGPARTRAQRQQGHVK